MSSTKKLCIPVSTVECFSNNNAPTIAIADEGSLHTLKTFPESSGINKQVYEENKADFSKCITQNRSTLSIQAHLKECFPANYKYNSHYWLYDKPVLLYHYLNPVLDNLIKQAEASEFRYPVDPVKLKIPDYYDIIENPMDLSTIRQKLHSGQYQNGWEFIEDVWLMFNNAWTYNKKTTRVYKNASKLANLFKEEINKPMKQLGHCCGQYYTFDPKILFCISKQDCIIPKYAPYWNYKDKYHICKKCYNGIVNDTIVLQNSCESVTVNKKEFELFYNDVLNKEPFVECFKCGIKVHKICVLHSDDIWKEGFLCKNCITNLGKIKVPNKYASENLQKTMLGSHIEVRVNSFLKNQGCNSKVVIRLVCNSKKLLTVKKGAKSKFVENGIWPEHFPYSTKTVLAFQEIDKDDVCFFSLYVQEYDSQCSPPNTRCVFISYLDSVHFFSPKELRTLVYHEILLGYLDYVRNSGYTKVHLWACPPKEEEDYIFYHHPIQQKTPNTKKLLEWYKTMLDKAIKEKIVKDYKDIYTQVIEDNLKNISELPYFEGDFLPMVIEKEVSKLEGSEKKKVSCRSMTKTALSFVNEQKEKAELKEKSFKTKHKKGKKNLRSSKSFSNYSVGDPLTDNVLLFLQLHKEGFLVIHLANDINVSELPAIVDPDPKISSGLMCLRDTFLEFCRENDYEFSSLRRAKYSSMILLYELHKENIDTFSCNHCKSILETGFHCNVCKDFDLCSKCYNLNGHEHDMEDLKINAESDSFECYPDRSANFRILDHLSICSDANCLFLRCDVFKQLMRHFETCKKGREVCNYCGFIFPLVAKHSKKCKIVNCRIRSCAKMKRLNCTIKLKKEQCCVISVARNREFCNTNTMCLLQNAAKNTETSTHLDVCKRKTDTGYLPFTNTSQSKEDNTTALNKHVMRNASTIYKNIEPENTSESKSSRYVEFQNSISNGGVFSSFAGKTSQSEKLNTFPKYATSGRFNKQYLETENVKEIDVINERSIIHSKKSLEKFQIDNCEMDDVNQNISNMPNSETELLEENTYTPVKTIKSSSIFCSKVRSAQNGDNSTYVSDTSVKCKLSADILEQKYTSNSLNYPEKALLKISNNNSSVCSPVGKTDKNIFSYLPNNISVNQISSNETSDKESISVDFSKMQSYPKHNSVTYSDTNNFVSISKTFNSVSILKKCSEENNIQNLGVNLPSSNFSVPVYPTIEQNIKIPINKSKDSPKISVYGSNLLKPDKTSQFYLNISSASNHNIRNRNVKNYKNYPISDLFKQEKSLKTGNCHEKSDCHKLVPFKLMKLPENFKKVYLNPVSHISNSSNYNPSVSSRNTEYSIPGTAKFVFKQENSKPDMLNISDSGMFSKLDDNARVMKTFATSDESSISTAEYKVQSFDSKCHSTHGHVSQAFGYGKYEKYQNSLEPSTQQLVSNHGFPMSANTSNLLCSSLDSVSNSHAKFSPMQQLSVSIDKYSTSSVKEIKPVIVSSNTSTPQFLNNKSGYNNFDFPMSENTSNTLCTVLDSIPNPTVEFSLKQHVSVLDTYDTDYRKESESTVNSINTPPNYKSGCNNLNFSVLSSTPNTLYTILDSASKFPAEFSFRQHVPVSINEYNTNSGQEIEPVIDSINSQTPDFLNYKSGLNHSFDLSESSFEHNQINSQEVNNSEKMSFISTGNFESNLITNTFANFKPLDENTNAHTPSKYSLDQPLKSCAINQYNQKSYVTENNIPNSEKTLPGFETFCRNSYSSYNIENKKISYCKNNIDGVLENSKMQIECIPKLPVSPFYFQSDGYEYNKTSQLNPEVSVKKSEPPAFNYSSSNTTSMFDYNPSRSLDTNFENFPSSTEIGKNENQKGMPTFAELSNMHSFVDLRNQNNCGTNSVIGKSTNSSCMEMVCDVSNKQQNSQNSFQYGGHLNPVDNIKPESLYKPNETVFQTFTYLQPAYMSLDHNTNNISNITSNNTNYQLPLVPQNNRSTKNDIPIVSNRNSNPNCTNANNFTCYNSLESPVNKSLSCSNVLLENSLHCDNNGIIPDKSSQKIPFLHEDQNNCDSNIPEYYCNKSYVLCNNLSIPQSFFTASQSHTNSQLQLSFGKSLEHFKMAPTTAQAYTFAPLNNTLPQKNTAVKQKAVSKKRLNLSNVPYRKRGWKKKA